jgi:clathrin heavy chain
VRQQVNEGAQPEVLIIELKNGNNIIRRPIKADSAIMHWNKQIIALKAQQRTLQVFDLAAKAKLKSATMNEDVLFWKWFSSTSLGLVTDNSVYHWDVFDPAQAAPVKVFDRNANLSVRKTPREYSAAWLTLDAGLPDHQLPRER